MSTEMTGNNSLPPELTIPQIIHALRFCDDETPVAAIRAAVAYGQEIVPALLAEIEESAECSANDAVLLHDSHCLAVMLLTAIQAKDALPDILQLFSIDNNIEFPLFGEMLTETLPHIAAQLTDDPARLIDEIEDASHEPLYHAALVRGVFGMVVEGKLPREEAARLLQEQLAKSIASRDRDCVANLLSTLTDLAAPNTADLVLTAFDTVNVDPSIIDRDTCQAAFATADEHFQAKSEEFRQNRIGDPVEYFERLPRGIVFETPPANLDEAIQNIQGPTNSEGADRVVAAVRWLRRHREEAAPRLIKLLQDAATLRGDESDDQWQHSDAQDIATVLLIEFEFKPALPVILKGVCHPDPDVVDRFQRVIQDYLDQAVGRLADKPEEIREQAADPEVEVNEFVRAELVDGIYWMVLEGKLTRESATEYLQTWLNQAIDDSDDVLTTSIALSLMDLGAKQAESTIRRAFSEDCIDWNQLCEEEVDEWLEESDDQYEEEMKSRRTNRRIENSVFDVRSWMTFDDGGYDGYKDDDDEFDDEDDYGDDDPDAFGFYPRGLNLNNPADYLRGLEAVRQMRLAEESRSRDINKDDDYYAPPAVETIRNADTKVGRNDPCPCGSGKKYKKCCLKHDE